MSKPTYQQAFDELQRIVTEIENGKISVDELSEKVSRASDLIAICKAKLTTTEDNVQKILAAIEQPETSAGPGHGEKTEDNHSSSAEV